MKNCVLCHGTELLSSKDHNMKFEQYCPCTNKNLFYNSNPNLWLKEYNERYYKEDNTIITILKLIEKAIDDTVLLGSGLCTLSERIGYEINRMEDKP